MALTAGTLPNGTTYPATVQSLLTLFAQHLTAPNAPQVIHVSLTQPQGVSEGTGWFNPTTLELKIYATETGASAPAWHTPSVEDGFIGTDQIADGAVTRAKLDPSILTIIDSLSAASDSLVSGLVEPGHADSRRANFFVMLDGTLRVTGYGATDGGGSPTGKNGIGYRPGGDNSYFPKRCGFSPPLDTGETVSKVFTSRHASFVITSEGKLYSTGDANHYVLGNGTQTPNVHVFTEIAGALSGKVVTDLAFGSGEGKYISVFALTEDNKVYAWGRNDTGQLGLGSFSLTQSTPVEVTGLTSLVKNDGTTPDPVVKIVVANNGFTTDNGNTSGNTQGARVTTYALTEEGHVYSAGFNGQRQLGMSTGSTTNRNTFDRVLGLTSLVSPPSLYATDIAVASGGNTHGYFSAAAAMSNGTVMTWGTASAGQLGTGNLTVTSVPATVKLNSSPATPLGSTGDPIVSVQGFGRTFVALSEGGVAWGWGWNGDGGLGQGDKVNKEYAVQLGTNVTKITLGGNENNVSVVFLKNDNTIWGAGWNNRGQLGQGTSDNAAGTGPDRQVTTFKQVLGITEDVADVRLTSNWDADSTGTPTNGTSSLLILLATGKVLACGWDSTNAGQLGVDASPASLAVPSFVNF